MYATLGEIGLAPFLNYHTMFSDIISVLIDRLDICPNSVALPVADVVVTKGKDLFSCKGFSHVTVQAEVFGKTVGNEHECPRGGFDVAVCRKWPIPRNNTFISI